MTVPLHRISALAEVLLFKLYQLHASDDPREKISVDEIHGLFSVPVSRNLLKSALDRLRGRTYARGLITRHGNATAGYSYNINNDGIIEVEEALARKNSLIRYYSMHGDDELDVVAGIESDFLTVEEWQNRDLDNWEPLPLDRETSEYKNAVEAVENAIEILDKDNGFAANLPEQKKGIMSALKSGLEWLKDKSPSKAQINIYLIAPLQWVTSTFGKSFVGEAAKHAWNALLVLMKVS